MASVLAAGMAPALARFEWLMRPRQVLAAFGTMRVALPLIWCADIIEHAERAPCLTRYSYSASFRVAFVPFLEPESILRVFADGEELDPASWRKDKTGIAVRELTLDRFGCRVPEIIAEIEGRA